MALPNYPLSNTYPASCLLTFVFSIINNIVVSLFKCNITAKDYDKSIFGRQLICDYFLRK